MPKSNIHSLYTILSIRLVILLCSFKFNVNIILILYIIIIWCTSMQIIDLIGITLIKVDVPVPYT